MTTATQQISTITPPSSSHGSGPRGLWDFAVPIDNESSEFTDEKSYMPGSDRLIKSAYHLRQPFPQQTNGNDKMSEPQPPKALLTPENEYLNPPRTGHLTRKKSDVSHESSEPDHQPDTHKIVPESKSVPHGIDKGGKRKVSAGILNGKKAPEDDERNWIHRDKLAVIESKELEEAGFIGRVSRSASRAAGPVPPNRQQPVQESTHENAPSDPSPQLEVKKQPTISPIPTGEEEHEADGATEWDLRTPEEIAADQDDRQYFVHPLPARPNGSRLPLPKHSPAPVPSTIVDRDSPLTRIRNSNSAHGIPAVGELCPRRRSQILLDEDSPQTLTFRKSSNSHSESDRTPPKAKAPTKAAPFSGARKSSVQGRVVSTSKARNSSQASRDSPPKRPGTSSGLPRPSTSHRPEGDPPWIASMYKPDPRLPPDQQILPTHAKRMAQEQWEKEGRTGTVYDRDFRLLNTEEITKPEEKPLPELRQPSETETTNASAWSLHGSPPLGSPRSITCSRPGTSGTEHGRYRTMPNIAPTPQPITPTTTESKPTPVPAPVRVHESPEDVGEKKGCGACCIVM